MDGFIRPKSKKDAAQSQAGQTAEVDKKTVELMGPPPEIELPHTENQPKDISSVEKPIKEDDSKPSAEKKTKKHRIASAKEWVVNNKKFSIPLGVIALLLIAGGTVLALKLTSKKSEPPKDEPVVEQKKEEEPAKPVTEASPLTGVQVSPELAKRPLTGIMIENSIDARPQSGLNQAGVVYEAIAEGGITRLLAIFQESQPDYIGPIRSVRPYYVDWVAGFDAPLTHVGGSVDGLDAVRSYGKDMDQFANGAYFQRIKERYAPHNVYSSMAKLDELKQKLGYTANSFTPWPRKDPAPASTPTAKTINFDISGYTYNPRYEWDAASNTYKRFQDGEAHVDEKSKAQLAPNVVIAIVVPYHIVSSIDGSRYDYDTLGSGICYVFQDGLATQGTWTKAAQGDMMTFKDSAGELIKLNPGQTWISTVSGTNKVSYTP